MDEHVFLISSFDPWYEDILVYLQTLNFTSTYSRYDQRHIRHQVKNYLIINDILYHREVDSFLHPLLTHEEAETMLNNCHSGSCGDHLFELEATQKCL
jgi:hypothetical protein